MLTNGSNLDASEPRLRSSGYSRRMRWVLILLAIALVLAVLGWVISALKWLLVIAAVMVFASVLLGSRQRRDTTKY